MYLSWKRKLKKDKKNTEDLEWTCKTSNKAQSRGQKERQRKKELSECATGSIHKFQKQK